MLKVVVIEDEPRTREAIVKMVNQNCLTVKVVAEGKDIRSGLEAIRVFGPDILIIDIELSDGTAFDLLKKIDDIRFQVIFVTAHEGYALQAIKFSAFDYILKPFKVKELTDAVKRAKDKVVKEKSEASIETLLNHIDNTEDKKIVLKTLDDIHLVKVVDIIRCEADSSYTHFHLKDGSCLTVSGNLKGFEEMLGPYRFFRVHHSHLVNLNEVKKFQRAAGGQVLMTDDSKIPVSTRKKERLIEKFKTL
ncbi:MAG: LytTR family DNA-binding domain-containing protein [Bacteroidales bacterium]|nr:LytTR family DNA-binding domain-containing protein [Bacteroidales bacterium]